MAIEHVERRAARIKERREELGLTQEQVADLMHTAHGELHPDEQPDHTRGQMVSDWERAVNAPSPPKLELLALALKTTVADLSAGPVSQRAEVPDLLGSMNGDEPTQLDRIEKQLQDIHDVLWRLAPTPTSTGDGESLLDEATRDLEQGTQGPEQGEEDEGQEGSRSE